MTDYDILLHYPIVQCPLPKIKNKNKNESCVIFELILHDAYTHTVPNLYEWIPGIA